MHKAKAWARIPSYFPMEFLFASPFWMALAKFCHCLCALLAIGELWSTKAATLYSVCSSAPHVYIKYQIYIDALVMCVMCHGQTLQTPLEYHFTMAANTFSPVQKSVCVWSVRATWNCITLKFINISFHTQAIKRMAIFHFVWWQSWQIWKSFFSHCPACAHGSGSCLIDNVVHYIGMGWTWFLLSSATEICSIFIQQHGELRVEEKCWSTRQEQILAKTFATIPPVWSDVWMCVWVCVCVSACSWLRCEASIHRLVLVVCKWDWKHEKWNFSYAMRNTNTIENIGSGVEVISLPSETVDR